MQCVCIFKFPQFLCAVTVACHVIPASGRLVDVDIPKLSESPWPVFDIFWTSMGLGRQIVKELDLKLTLGMAERRKTESTPDEESWGGGQRFQSRSEPKSPSLGVWLFLVQLVTILVEHSSNVKQRPKKPSENFANSAVFVRSQECWFVCEWKLYLYTYTSLRAIRLG